MQHVHGATEQGSPQKPWWKGRTGIALGGFLVVAAFYLFTEHAAHTVYALPFLFLLACPLIHLFHHHGGGDHAEPPAPVPIAATPVGGPR